MALKAFLSRRMVTPEGIRPGAVLVDGERIRAVIAPGDVPLDAVREDFGRVDEARALMETLPLAQQHLIDHQFIPVGPLMPLRALLQEKNA